MLQFQIQETIITSEAKLRQPLDKKEPNQNNKMLIDKKLNEHGARL
jgi:hypothetical protein